MNVWQRSGVLLVVAVATFAVGMNQVRAQFVVADPLHTFQTILSEVKRGMDSAIDYANQARQLQSQIQQYENMVKNSEGLTDLQWIGVSQDIDRLTDLYQDSRSLASSMRDLDKQFGDSYGGYDRYTSEFGKGSKPTVKYEQWSSQGYDNALYSMRVAGMQVSMFEAEDVVLSNLVQKSQSAEGRMQALQVANAMAAQQVQQSQKLRQLVASQVQMQANALALAADRQAQIDANTSKFHQQPVIQQEGKGY